MDYQWSLLPVMKRSLKQALLYLDAQVLPRMLFPVWRPIRKPSGDDYGNYLYKSFF